VFFNRALFAASRRDHGIDSIAQLADTDIAGTLVFGVLADSINEQMLHKYLPQFAVKRYRDLPAMVTAVKEGEIFAGLHGELQLNYYMRRNPETAIYIGLEPRARHPSDICIAVRPDAPNLLRWVNVFLSNHVGLMDSDEIVERYITPRAR
jgi:ABC-type amino acid transport substrate-binding protein